MKTFKFAKGKSLDNLRAHKGGGAGSKYKWDEIFNGEANLITKGDDYTVDTLAMPPKIKTAARRRYKVAEVFSKDPDGNKLTDALIVIARDMTADERQAEDVKRAEEKAKRAEANGDGEETTEEAAE